MGPAGGPHRVLTFSRGGSTMLEVGLDYGACLRGQGGLCFKTNNGKHLVGRTRGWELHQES